LIELDYLLGFSFGSAKLAARPKQTKRKATMPAPRAASAKA
jgi:hypothetical protein